MTHSLRIFDALEPKLTPIQVCPVRGVDPQIHPPNFIVRYLLSNTSHSVSA